MMTEPSLYDVQYDCLWRQDVEEEMLDEQISDVMSLENKAAINLIGSALNEVYCNTAHFAAFEKAILGIYNTTEAFSSGSYNNLEILIEYDRYSCTIRELLQKQLRKLIRTQQ